MARKTMSALSKDERAARNDRVVALLKAGKSYKEIEEQLTELLDTPSSMMAHPHIRHSALFTG